MFAIQLLSCSRRALLPGHVGISAFSRLDHRLPFGGKDCSAPAFSNAVLNSHGAGGTISPAGRFAAWKDTGFEAKGSRFEPAPAHFAASLRCITLASVALSQLKLLRTLNWPVGLMDKASASGAGDSRFESWAGHFHHVPYATHENQFLLTSEANRQRGDSNPCGQSPMDF